MSKEKGTNKLLRSQRIMEAMHVCACMQGGERGNNMDYSCSEKRDESLTEWMAPRTRFPLNLFFVPTFVDNISLILVGRDYLVNICFKYYTIQKSTCYPVTNYLTLIKKQINLNSWHLQILWTYIGYWTEPQPAHKKTQKMNQTLNVPNNLVLMAQSTVQPILLYLTPVSLTCSRS